MTSIHIITSIDVDVTCHFNELTSVVDAIRVLQTQWVEFTLSMWRGAPIVVAIATAIWPQPMTCCLKYGRPSPRQPRPSSAFVCVQQFHSKNGRAYLFKGVVNVCFGSKEERLMTTGVHIVRDAYCIGCMLPVGWKYVTPHCTMPGGRERRLGCVRSCRRLLMNTNRNTKKASSFWNV